MKYTLRATILFAGVIFFGALAGLGARWFASFGPSNTTTAFQLDHSDPDYAKVMCGPVSLSVALGRLGVCMTAEEIATQCRVTSSGVSLADLEQVAVRLPRIRAVARRLVWDELRAIDGVAVLFVNGNHFVAADPRLSSSDNSVIVYDGGVPARPYSTEELGKIWSGEALVVSRQQPSSTVMDGARIDWDECYIDNGFLTETAVTSFEFSFRNEGNQDLSIEAVKTSCGCIKHSISTKLLAPKASAHLNVDVDLVGKDGYVQQHVIVQTNDSEVPVSILEMKCGIPRKRSVSSSVIRLEDLAQGSSRRQEIVIADTNFAGIVIRDASFVLRDNCRSINGLSCKISCEKIFDNANTVKVRTGFPASRGDYLASLQFSADSKCLTGPFEGDVIVNVETDDVTVTHKIEIQGMVVPDVQSVPKMILITLGPELESVGSATLRLESKANRNITVVKAWVESMGQMNVSRDTNAAIGTHTFVVSVSMPNLGAGSIPLTGTAMFELEHGSLVSVPVTVFRPRRE